MAVCGASIEAPSRGACRLGRDQAIAIGRSNRLTANRSRHYSDGMISDFNLLATKITELATLTHDLRRENAALRKQVASLGHDNDALQARIVTAHQRVAGLLQSLPDPVAELHDDVDPPDLRTTDPHTTDRADDDDPSDASTTHSESMRQSP